MTRSGRNVAVAAFLTAASAAGAQETSENLCRQAPRLSEGAACGPGRIVGAGRVRFVRDGLARKGCPGADPACAARGYLVPGDRVVLGERRKGYVCATFPQMKTGLDTTGWLPEAAVAPELASPVTREAWLGVWRRVEARIAIEAGAEPGTVAIDGSATWGAGDPERAQRGSVHLGEIGGTVAPADGALSFAMGEKGTLPLAKGGEFDCKVWMRRVGPWLVVDDNLACGGLNVSFRGVYRREGT
jgi:hypothetical protein